MVKVIARESVKPRLHAVLADGSVNHAVTTKAIRSSADEIPLSVHLLLGVHRASAPTAKQPRCQTVLVLGGICALLVRSRGIRAGRPMSSAARYGSILGFVVVSGATVEAFLNQFALMAIVGLTLAVNAVILVFGTREGRSGLRRGLAALWIGAGCALLAALFCIWHAPASTPIVDLWTALLGGIEIPLDGINLGLVGALAWLSWALPVVPFLVAIGIGIVSIVCRVPLSVGWVRGFRGLVAPVSCLLCLIYAGIIVRTVRQEAFASYTIQRFVQHDGRFVAEVRGKPWPGETKP